MDNYDSFTFNLVHAVADITGEMPVVIRNDEMTWDEIARLAFNRIIISPGPGRPDRERDFGVSRDAILNARVPVLGVCLGHQGIASLFGGEVRQMAPVHGRASEILHTDDELFAGIPQRFSAIRYHSLAVMEPLPAELRKIAWTEDGTVMALRHLTRPLWGVQFHPESVASEYGRELLRNFLEVADAPSSWPLKCPPEVLFRNLFAGEKYAFWLDGAARGRFSYMGASDIVIHDGFDRVDELLKDGRRANAPFPFAGGYVGYFGYECGHRHKHRSPLPDSVLLRVENFIAIDHAANAMYLVGSEDWVASIEARIDEPTAPPPRWNRGRPCAHYAISRCDYLERVKQSIAWIEAGESYELCLTNKVCFDTDIPALDYYETLRRANPAPYAAFLQLDDIQVASTSPECFLRIDRERRAWSRPIKGTVRRGRDEEEDARLRDLLANDPRFRAENLMIVDLVRHDLSRVCEVGSVRVPGLMEVESYETVHQLVSTIEGRLRADATTGDCLRALYPGGSMTGAPKLRSMELLDELEPDARGIYSGAIGYLGFDGTVDLSIVIRTAIFRGGHVSLGVGGAIVAQSDPEAEWDEMDLKAQALLRAFELA
ncbi:MAG TPA: aminodeoxychorismate synthase component I [Bryobacteraceae bacterium]|nr:aminodeoxychorismate synthase component I [Bryobacteraceae bacterium]